MKFITTEKTPIFSWCNDAEDGAIEQAKNLANLPFIFKQVCLMPDTHQGYGMPIGGVIACKDVIIPNAVGVDIGCGMLAVKTSLTGIDKDTILKILSDIRGMVPVGFNHLEKPVSIKKMPILNYNHKVCESEFESARKQMGTLGGGNHFIEIQQDADGFIWFMIHSGSRNLGYKVAKYYNKLAVDINIKWFSSVPKQWELAFLPIKTEEAKDYKNEMDFCLDFALRNRTEMALKIKESFLNHIQCDFNESINIHHNYARYENHFGNNVIIHRKGATSAKKDELGIIPGSQGTKSYIVKGLGNEKSFCSCSHGAGRKMSRMQAKISLNLKEEQNNLDRRGIIHSIRGVDSLDEAPSAYKDISIVIKEQEDLVKVIHELTPLAVIKG